MAKKLKNVSLLFILVFIERCVKSFESMNPSKQITETFMTEVERYGHLD